MTILRRFFQDQRKDHQRFRILRIPTVDGPRPGYAIEYSHCQSDHRITLHRVVNGELLIRLVSEHCNQILLCPRRLHLLEQRQACVTQGDDHSFDLGHSQANVSAINNLNESQTHSHSTLLSLTCSRGSDAPLDWPSTHSAATPIPRPCTVPSPHCGTSGCPPASRRSC